MKIGSMFSDIAVSLFRRPVTQLYPFEIQAAPTRLRGVLHWHRENCTGCGMCAKDCPSGAVEMFVIDKKEKRFVMKYHIDRCTFCAQCVNTCMQDGLEMSSAEWELGAFDLQSFENWYGEADDVEFVLAGKLTQPA